ncbi:RNA-guided endonuclease TnpB family protein [Haloquadratum walsbyi]|uniref:Transposase, IS605 OrfB family, central region n=1 Tax=Haloquadratum walsbyi J07HQW2 TaxID=1238425 RepID=U1PXM4_9EURY|nr:RNA-guided endonuclease TnpB family protein [Haloquadratum walsbyi]ERG97221.1 MAG: transposase, IS605 OrfB family, central region [Haloquadratum walsbyi J07HQW2]
MNYAYRYRIHPTESQRETLDHHLDTCRQIYNHTLHELNNIPESAGTVNQRVNKVIKQLPDLKEWWDELTELYSTVSQDAAKRVAKNIIRLSGAKQNGLKVGSLNWKSPREYQSFTYVQSGFEFDNKNGQTVLSLSKLADIPLSYHRDISETVNIKRVTLKREPTGEWYASFAVDEKEEPAKPDDPQRCVGIDVGILKYAQDTDGRAVGFPDLQDNRERLRREQRALSRKEQGSNNWEKQRQTVAEYYQTLRRKCHDFLHKLSNYYATQYDLVAVEDLDVKSMLKSSGNSRKTAFAAWDTFTTMLEYKCKREGTHFVEVEPAGTTKECASCSVETKKPLCVREHSCPACGFEMDRDANAAINILSRSFKKLGLGQSEDTTPVETALPMFTSSGSVDVVDGKRVIESGSPTLHPRGTNRESGE